MSLLREHKKAIDDLTTIAIAEVVGVLTLIRDQPLNDFAGSLRNTLPIIASEFSSAAQVVSTNYYDQSRALSNPSTAYAARTIDYDSITPVEAGIGYAISKAYREQPFESVVTLLAGNMQRVVAGADRENLFLNIDSDPVGRSYERVPSVNGCSFCLTMAAVAEVRRTDSFSKYHDFCRCTSRVIFEGQSPTELPIYSQARSAYSLANQELQRRREEVGYSSLKRNVAAKKYPDLTLTTKNHLRLVRQITGWN
jgi:hypothetical protein